MSPRGIKYMRNSTGMNTPVCIQQLVCKMCGARAPSIIVIYTDNIPTNCGTTVPPSTATRQGRGRRCGSETCFPTVILVLFIIEKRLIYMLLVRTGTGVSYTQLLGADFALPLICCFVSVVRVFYDSKREYHHNNSATSNHIPRTT